MKAAGRFSTIVALGGLLASAEPEPREPAVEVTHCYDAIVTRVHDGDTPYIDVHLGFGVWFRDEPVRLLDCWAPELRDPGGHDAKLALEGLLDADPLPGFQAGRRVILRGHDREKYGRLLGSVFADGVDVGAELVRRRHAKRGP